MKKHKKFDWGRLGVLEEGRGSLGPEMPVAVYRLMQYTIMDELNELFSKDEAEVILRNAGYRAGEALAENLLDLNLDFDDFTEQLRKTLKHLKVGILMIEKMDLDSMKFTLTVDEDLDCSGLPVYGETVCFYDEGFIAAIFTLYTGKPMTATEIDCWATGARTCRFQVSQNE